MSSWWKRRLNGDISLWAGLRLISHSDWGRPKELILDLICNKNVIRLKYSAVPNILGWWCWALMTMIDTHRIFSLKPVPSLSFLWLGPIFIFVPCLVQITSNLNQRLLCLGLHKQVCVNRNLKIVYKKNLWRLHKNVAVLHCSPFNRPQPEGITFIFSLFRLFQIV